jgi:hypothetical protein
MWQYLKLVCLGIFVMFFISLASANSYVVDTYFTLPETVYTTSERIELKGYVFEANYSNNGTLVSASAGVVGGSVNITIRNSGGVLNSNYTLGTHSDGSFYSASYFYPNVTNITAPSSGGDYILRGQYIDANNTAWYSEIGISVVNESVDVVRVSSKRARYNPSENISVKVEAYQLLGDRILHTANVSVNGSVQNSSKYVFENFSCTTGENGKCFTTVTAPTSNGDYVLEIGNYKSFSSFSVVPFFYSIYMKDELGQSLKNVYAQGEDARVEVGVKNATSTDEYIFYGYIADSSGNVIESINSTDLNNNNSFTNTFLFTLDALNYDFGAYGLSITVNKTGDGSIRSSTSFEVKDWLLSINKKEVGSGFEYGHSVFPNITMFFEAYPKYRSNGSVIENINASAYVIRLKDNLNNIVDTGNATWNATCGNEGCYEFNLTSPITTGTYSASVELSHNGITQTKTRVVKVINSVMSVTPTNKDGALKELFGTNEFAYLSLNSYNTTSSKFNLSDGEVFSVIFSNGTEFSYTKVSSFKLVNATNSDFEWAWNITSQRLKLDVPPFGGDYSVFVFGNNKSVGTLGRFIVNPYEICASAKDTPGTVSSGFYYSWQFKTTDTIYFELKVIQADNPLGRATASNFSTLNSSIHGLGSGCSVDTATQQVVNNATITIAEVRNAESGSIQNINDTETVCQADDNSGGYSCTIKPSASWEGGVSVVKFDIEGRDGSKDVAYSRFEARAFYLYGWSQTWQNNPDSDITLNVRLYEPGSGWWGSSGGLSGTISLKRVEYQGRDGEWIWPPVDSGYNVSNITASVTSGSGSLSLPAASAVSGVWKTGYYRAIIQGTTSDGETDYGYAWFGIKRWNVYGYPMECDASNCKYKSYFNSKENVTIFVKINKAGAYNYNDNGNGDIFGNVSVGVKKIEDCRSWPCRELNSSDYSASSINVNKSSPWHWNTNLTASTNYLIHINTTKGTWGTGYYSVTLDVNGTDTGRAWFNTIAFYVDRRSTDFNSTNYVYSIKPAENRYYNVTLTRNYRGYGAGYNGTDLVNATIEDIVLRKWDQITYQSVEYKYQEDVNASVVGTNDSHIEGNGLVNISYLNGSWPSGHYSGEMTLKNKDGETSTGWVSFRVQPFRISTTVNTYNVDEDQCINASLHIYEPFYYNSRLAGGNYSITNVYENIWSGGSYSQTSYSNFTGIAFNSSTNMSVCPNNGNWGAGSWGGYHYLRLVVKDNVQNDTEIGWMSFRAQPFQIHWGTVVGGTNKLTTENVVVPVNVTKYVSGASTSGNITRMYQWRSDDSFRGEEDYTFSIGDCFSNVTGSCNVSGVQQNVTVYPPSHGWKVGYNYIQSEWSKQGDSSSTIRDYSGIYIEGRESYNGYFSNSDTNGYWKRDFASDENITVKLYIRNSSYASANVNVTKVEYAVEGGNCWDEWCRSYTTTTTWSLSIGGNETTNNGSGIIMIAPPSGGWGIGEHRIKTSVSGSAGTATITGGTVRVKDMAAPNVTINSPANNDTVTDTSFLINWTTTKNAECNVYMTNYDNFFSYSCNGWNSTGNATITPQFVNACNKTKYNYTGATHMYQYVHDDYYYLYDGSKSKSKTGTTGLTTGGTKHNYRMDVGNLTTQHYGVEINCYDSGYENDKELVTFYLNSSLNESSSRPGVTVVTPAIDGYNFSTSSIDFNVTTDKNSSCLYAIISGVGSINLSMATVDSLKHGAKNTSIGDAAHYWTVHYYCNDSNGNVNNSHHYEFGVDTQFANITYNVSTPVDGANLSNSLYVRVNIDETNLNNVTFRLYNGTGFTNISSESATLNAGIKNPFVNWTGLANGNYTYNVSVFDTAGNFNSTESRTVTISSTDVTPPGVTINSPTDKNYSTSSIDLNVSLSEDVYYCSYSLDSGVTNVSMENSATSNVTYNSTNNSIADGHYTARFYCNDTSNNWNLSESTGFTIDTLYPSITYNTSTYADGANVTGAIFVEVNIIEIHKKNITFTLMNNTGTVNTTIKNSGFTDATTWHSSVNWTGLAGTNYTFNVTTYDEAGNFNSTATRHINVSAIPDATAPTITVNSPLDGNYSSPLYYNVTLNEDGGSCLLSYNIGTTNVTMENSNNRNYNYTNASIGDGYYSFHLFCNDSSGNLANTTGSYGVDSTYPTISYNVSTLADGSNFSGSIFAQAVITETNVANVTFTLFNSSGLSNRTTYSGSAAAYRKINWTLSAASNYTFNISTVDGAGNFNATASRIVQLT